MALEGWSAERLDAAARLWKRDRKVFTARFAGTSMRPTIGPGEEVRVRCGVGIRPGDVAVCQQGRRILVHRVLFLSRRADWVLTRGDATCVPDLPIPVDSVLGTISGLVADDGEHDLPPAPDSWTRRAIGRLSEVAFNRTPAIGRFFVRSLWFLRKWLFVIPGVAVRRLRGRGGAPGEQE